MFIGRKQEGCQPCSMHSGHIQTQTTNNVQLIHAVCTYKVLALCDDELNTRRTCRENCSLFFFFFLLFRMPLSLTFISLIHSANLDDQTSLVLSSKSTCLIGIMNSNGEFV